MFTRSRSFPFPLLLILVCSSFIHRTESKCINGVDANLYHYESPKKDFVASWSIDCPSLSIRFNVTASALGWIGVGFNKVAGMHNADIIQFAVAKDTNEVLIVEGISHGNHKPKPGTLELKDIAGSVNSTHTTVSFRRPFKTTQSNLYTLSPSSSVFLIWAYTKTNTEFGAGHLGGGAGYGFVWLNLFSVGTDSNPDPFIIHGLIMIVCWAYLVGGAILLSRYMKDIGHMWFVLHYSILLVVTILTIGSSILAFIYADGNVRTVVHSILGILVLVGVTVQPLIGYLSNRLWSPLRTSTPFWPDKLHWWVGRGTWAIAIATIFLGFDVYHVQDVSPWIVCGGWIGLIMLIFIIAELKFGAVHHNTPPETKVTTTTEIAAKPKTAEDSEKCGMAARELKDRAMRGPMRLLFAYSVVGAVFTAVIIWRMWVGRRAGAAHYN